MERIRKTTRCAKQEIQARNTKQSAQKSYASSSGGAGARGTEPQSEVNATLTTISADMNSQYSVHEKEKASTLASVRSGYRQLA
ncbi:hypothetical protein BZM27_17715 [Paraburkholderia steynii]|uniref:Uncharacterized protein n=1 Tax=Paraburkholderia steynii TaxID=1245441 RepID=A0A4V2NH70_9BURK|nr:hypothetical protein BZM27_17715 [Paraburkholderia steynii]